MNSYKGHEFCPNGPAQNADGQWYVHWKIRHHLSIMQTGPEERSAVFDTEEEAKSWLDAEKKMFYSYIDAKEGTEAGAQGH